MRREFCTWASEYARRDDRFLFLTGDLGFMALEELQCQMKARFLNMGVSEQNMVAVAAALAKEGLHPLCYSIAPFLVFRPYEQIRLDVALHGLPVKFVGNGGGYGYGIMGASHHALQDLGVLSCLPHFECVVPLSNEDVGGAANYMMRLPKPVYLRLGAGKWPAGARPLPSFEAVRTLHKTDAPRVTIAGMGPVLLNVLGHLPGFAVDCFAISTSPLPGLPESFSESVRRSGRLWVLEEHTSRGGLAEELCRHLAQSGVRFCLHHDHACGYPGGLYGSQKYHWEASSLDSESLGHTLRSLLNTCPE